MAGKQGILKLTRNEVLAVACIHILLLAGCADQKGDDPYAMWEVYQHDLYYFRYLKPPWVFVESRAQPDQQLIAVSPTQQRIGYDIEEGNLHADITATVTLVNRHNARSVSYPDYENARSLAYADYTSYQKTATEVSEPERFKSANGFEGFRVDATFPDRHIVAAYQDVRHQDIVVMKVASEKSLDNADITLLLRSLEPGSPDEE